MLLACMRRFAPAGAPRLARAFCSAEAGKAELLEFLKSASRPIMGKAKAKQSAGQKPLDMTKQASRLDDLDLPGLLRCDSEELKRRGVPCQERKRLLNFADKYRQGYRHDGRQGKRAWRGWLPPYRQPGGTKFAAVGTPLTYQDPKT